MSGCCKTSCVHCPAEYCNNDRTVLVRLIGQNIKGFTQNQICILILILYAPKTEHDSLYACCDIHLQLLFQTCISNLDFEILKSWSINCNDEAELNVEVKFDFESCVDSAVPSAKILQFSWSSISGRIVRSMSYLKPYTVLWLTETHHTRYKGHFSVMRKERSVPTMKSMQGESFIVKQYKKGFHWLSWFHIMQQLDGSWRLQSGCFRSNVYQNAKTLQNQTLQKLNQLKHLQHFQSVPNMKTQKHFMSPSQSAPELARQLNSLGASTSESCPEVEEDLAQNRWSSTLLPHGSKRRKLLEVTCKFLSSRTSQAMTRSAALSWFEEHLYCSTLHCFASLRCASDHMVSITPNALNFLLSQCSHSAWNHADVTSVLYVQKKKGLRLLQACSFTLR